MGYWYWLRDEWDYVGYSSDDAADEDDEYYVA
jgi:hypothetical protein